MRKTLDFYFDFISPASYLAWTQLPTLCEQYETALNPVPMFLGGLMKATGNRPPMAVAAKGRHLMTDLQRHADLYGVRFNANPAFPFNTLPLLRMSAGLKLQEPEKLRAFIDVVFRGIWVEAQNFSDGDTTKRYLQAAGFEPDTLYEMATDPQLKSLIAANTEEAEKRGAFGAPTMFFAEQMFFGQDRLDFVRRALDAA